MKYRIFTSMLLLASCMFAETSKDVMKFADTSQEYSSLLENFNEQLDRFENEPMQEEFDKAKELAERLIEKSPKDPRAYTGLHVLYSKAEGTLLETFEAKRLGLEVLQRYEQLDGERYNLSDWIARAEDGIKSRKGYEYVQKYTAQMEEDEKQPEAVLRARELLSTRATTLEKSQAYQNEAQDLLQKALKDDPDDYKLYAALAQVFDSKRDWPNAYAACLQAHHFGGSESFLVQEQTRSLYLEAFTYEKKYLISEENPGDDWALYYLWLQRETLWDLLTERSRESARWFMEKREQSIQKWREKMKKEYPDLYEQQLKPPTESSPKTTQPE